MQTLFLVRNDTIQPLRIFHTNRAVYICSLPDDTQEVIQRREVLTTLPCSYNGHHRPYAVFASRELAQRYLHELHCEKLQEVYGL